MLLDAVDESLELPAQVYTPSTQDKLVEVLAMPGIHSHPGVDVRVHEHIVEQRKARQGPIPSAVLEHRVGRATLTVENDVWWMRRRKSPTLRNGNRITGCQRAQDRRQRRLAATILGVDQHEPAEGNLSSRVHRVELPDVAEQLDPSIESCAHPRDEPLGVLDPQLAGDELGQQRVAQGGESAGFASAVESPRQDRVSRAFEPAQE